MLTAYPMLHILYTPDNTCIAKHQLRRWIWEALPEHVKVVGINTSPLDVLYYFPQARFLEKKVGGAFRYRDCERVVIAQREDTASTHLLRWALARLRLATTTTVDRLTIQAHLPLSDRYPPHHTTSGGVARGHAADALVSERTIDYLARPSVWTRLSLILAKCLHL